MFLNSELYLNKNFIFLLKRGSLAQTNDENKFRSETQTSVSREQIGILIKLCLRKHVWKKCLSYTTAVSMNCHIHLSKQFSNYK